MDIKVVGLVELAPSPGGQKSAIRARFQVTGKGLNGERAQLWLSREEAILLLRELEQGIRDSDGALMALRLQDQTGSTHMAPAKSPA